MPLPSSTLLDVDIDGGGAGIHGVFHQFLDHRRRTFDHFAGGDLVGNAAGQDGNAWHDQN
jgi:hypothetical protein